MHFLDQFLSKYSRSICTVLLVLNRAGLVQVLRHSAAGAGSAASPCTQVRQVGGQDQPTHVQEVSDPFTCLLVHDHRMLIEILNAYMTMMFFDAVILCCCQCLVLPMLQCYQCLV